MHALSTLVLMMLLTGSMAAERGGAVPGFAPGASGWSPQAATGMLNGQRVEGLDHEADAFYHLCVPRGYDPNQAWPLVLVLHGGPGGRADALASVFAKPLAERGAITVYPQALRKVLLEWNYPHASFYLLRIIRQVAASYRIDPQRVLLIGHSMGGGGTWLNGAVMHEVWAGIGPMSGWYAPTPKPDQKLYRNLPIYCLHGDNDRAVPVALSRMADQELQALQHPAWTYRELAGIGHNIFVKQTKDELAAFADWLLQQRKPRPADLNAAATRVVAWGKQFSWSPEGGPVGSYSE